MKALTLHQPWATALALGIKDPETRSWRTSYRGPLAIHAGKRTDFGGRGIPTSKYRALAQPLADAGMSCIEGHLGATEAWDCRACLALLLDFPLGAIVATCRLVDVVPTDELRWAGPGGAPFTWTQYDDRDDDPGATWVHEAQRPWGDYTPGRWAWLLDDVKPTTERCPACGGKGDDGQAAHAAWPYCSTCKGLLACDPVPARGRRGLWEWTP